MASVGDGPAAGPGVHGAGVPAFDLSRVIDRLHEGVQVIGHDFTYLYVNEVAALQGRSSVEALSGRRMTEAFPGIEDTEMFVHLRRVIEEGGTHRMENEFAYPDGARRWFELHIEGVPQGAVVLSLDVTERKRTDMNLRRAQRMEAVGQLAGGVAHDFNNLLTVIQSYVSLSLEELGEAHPVRGDLETVLSASLSAAALTHKLLAFARQLPVEPGDVRVGEAIEKVSALVRKAVGQAVTVALEVPPDLPKVRIDPSAFEQVILNLALNARDAMPDGGRLSISASRVDIDEDWVGRRGVGLEPGAYVVVAVADSGAGIPREIQDQIFDPFFSTKGDAGTGLGLTMCWALTHQAGGTVTVYSEEGLGTTFKVFLPVQQAAAAAVGANGPATAHAAPPATGTILVVEDEEALRALVGRVLRGAGYRLLEAASGAEALLVMEDVGDRVDLVLTDVVMPRMSGPELVRRLVPNHPGVRVLFMSGLAEPGHGLAGPSRTDFLAKPFTPTTLLAAVHRALSSEPPAPEPQREPEGPSPTA